MMRIPHVVVPELVTDLVQLSTEQDRHLRRVLRLRDGARITLTDGCGTVADGVLTGDATSVEERRSVPPPPRVTLVVSVSKGKKLDLVVEKTTELGVSRVVPVLTHRSERRWEDAKARAKVSRLEAVARSALEQSRGAWMPEIRLPLPWDAVLTEGAGQERIVLHPAEGEAEQPGAKAILAAEPAWIAVGPEGGFSSDEIDAALSAGWQVVGLGDRLLRTETAAVVAVALALAGRGGLQ